MLGLFIQGGIAIFGGVGVTTKESHWGLLAFTPAVWFLGSVIYYSVFPNVRRRNKLVDAKQNYFKF